MISKSKRLFISLIETIAIIIFVSCNNQDLSEKFVIKKFIEQTGVEEGCTIDSVKRYGNQALVYASLTYEEIKALQTRLSFESKEDFSKEYWYKGYVPLSKTLLNLDTLSENGKFFLKVYTNRSGKIATSYFITILPSDNKKLIFAEVMIYL